MKILVTGAAGYIGSVLCGVLLETGHDVVALDDLSCGFASLMGYAHRKGFTFLRGDVRDEATMRSALVKVDAIIPLAAVVGMPACDREPERAKSVNVDAIALLMRLRSKDQRVVFPNTNSGYGSTAGTCTEETTLSPISLYGRLKAEAEQLVVAGENAVALRLATVFGLSLRMRRDLLVNDFVWRAMTEKRLVVFEGHAMRNYVHVDDVAHAFRAIATEWPTHGVFNYGNDEINLSKWDLAQKVAAHLLAPRGGGSTVEVLLGRGEDPDKRNYTVSSEKLARHGVRATIGLDEGIDELIAGYRTMPELQVWRGYCRSCDLHSRRFGGLIVEGGHLSTGHVA